MEKILNNYGGAILLYIVIFIGVVAISNKFAPEMPNKGDQNYSIALND